MAMLKERQGWRCSNCNSMSKHAHLRAVQDYTLLFSVITTNSELRNFLIWNLVLRLKDSSKQ